ncbi:MAG: hypothetical protein LBJ38_02145 [Oscillospiraceae bacterium]|jgi:hypothetical protein|nr:hypothetical protein [Oscillospiraceae bacterium]
MAASLPTYRGKNKSLAKAAVISCLPSPCVTIAASNRGPADWRPGRDYTSFGEGKQWHLQRINNLGISLFHAHAILLHSAVVLVPKISIKAIRKHCSDGRMAFALKAPETLPARYGIVIVRCQGFAKNYWEVGTVGELKDSKHGAHPYKICFGN